MPGSVLCRAPARTSRSGLRPERTSHPGNAWLAAPATPAHATVARQHRVPWLAARAAPSLAVARDGGGRRLPLPASRRPPETGRIADSPPPAPARRRQPGVGGNGKASFAPAGPAGAEPGPVLSPPRTVPGSQRLGGLDSRRDHRHKYPSDAPPSRSYCQATVRARLTLLEPGGSFGG